MTLLVHAPTQPFASAQITDKPDRRRGHTSSHRDFRPDIEGLRAVAVLTVVLFHAGVPFLDGGYVGVDVFFVISGFLITSQMLREVAVGGRISVGRFYARRVLRLLPASTFVIVLTLAAAWLWLPPLRVKEIAVDAFTTTFYGMNYRLAMEGTDYLSSTRTPSPLQHFWSLAVEEQFYLVWPLVLMAIVLVSRRLTTAAVPRGPIVVVLALVIATSFVAGVYLTGTSAPWAYFGAHTRAWELAIGALIAVIAPALTRFTAGQVLIGRWIGLVGIAAAAVLFSESTQFPGYAAGLPVLATACVIVTGCARPESSLLGSALMQEIGRLSYSWYLWHWPVLIIGPYALGELSLIKSLGLAGLSLLLAAATTRRVEDPLRGQEWLRGKVRRSMAFGAALSAGVVGLSLLTPAALPSTAGNGTAVDSASALSTGSEAERKLVSLIAASARTTRVPANLQPSVADASKDVGGIYVDGCDPEFTESDVKKPCVYGDPTSARTVVLFGDSHAGHWFPALDEIARNRHWRLAVVTKSACSAASVSVYMPTLKRAYEECVRWRASAFDYINGLNPVLIVMSSNGHGEALNVGSNQDVGWAQAWRDTFSRFGSTKLMVISDTAWPKGDVPECISNHMSDVDKCNRSRGSAFSDGRRRRLVAEAARNHGAIVVDPAPWLCTEDVCPVIVGNVMVYKDDSHISATYSRLVAPILEQHFTG